MKNQLFKQMKTATATVLLFVGMLFTTETFAQGDGSIWRKTIVVSTLDGTTMEYLIDQNTKVRVEKPDLIIETEGAVLTFELDNMGQLRYGKRIISNVNEVNLNKSFAFNKETFFFEQLPENSLIEVFSSDGKMVESRRCSGNAQFSIHHLSPGTYVIKANNDTYKIMKR